MPGERQGEAVWDRLWKLQGGEGSLAACSISYLSIVNNEPTNSSQVNQLTIINCYNSE